MSWNVRLPITCARADLMVSTTHALAAASMLLKIQFNSPFGPAMNPSMEIDILRMSSVMPPELTPEPCHGCRIGLEPRGMPKKAVYLVRQHELLVAHALRVEPAREVDGLMKMDVAIVVALDKQNRRTPVRDVGDRR